MPGTALHLEGGDGASCDGVRESSAAPPSCAPSASPLSLLLRCASAETSLEGLRSELHSTAVALHRSRVEAAEAQRRCRAMESKADGRPRQRREDGHGEGDNRDGRPSSPTLGPTTIATTPGAPGGGESAPSSGVSSSPSDSCLSTGDAALLLLSPAEWVAAMAALRRSHEVAVSGLLSQHAQELSHLLSYKGLCAELKERLEDAELALEAERSRLRRSRAVVEKCAAAQRRFEASEGTQAETVARIAQQLLQRNIHVNSLTLTASHAQALTGRGASPSSVSHSATASPVVGRCVAAAVLHRCGARGSAGADGGGGGGGLHEDGRLRS